VVDSANSTRFGDECFRGVSLSHQEFKRAIEIATIVMKYVKGVPGGLHYTKDVPTDTFGARGQLKAARHPALLAV
jgi:hypothetical protein